MRGNLSCSRGTCLTLRSIPACAGEPAGLTSPVTADRVYPRVCGGTGRGSTTCACSRGLSPRVRGNRQETTNPDYGIGSIPACAGEPPVSQRLLCLGRVYPRVCGGTKSSCRSRLCAGGLSPRVRGNRLTDSQAAFRKGSIPACAGEPLTNVIEYAQLYSNIEYC